MKALKTLLEFICFLYENRELDGSWQARIARLWKKDPAYVFRLVRLGRQTDLIHTRGHNVYLTGKGKSVAWHLQQAKVKAGVDPPPLIEMYMAFRSAFMDGARFVWEIFPGNMLLERSCRMPYEEAEPVAKRLLRRMELERAERELIEAAEKLGLGN